MSSALVVRGGWEGHRPVETTELFLPGLRAAGFDLTISDGLAVYEDADKLRDFDLIVQCWSIGELTEGQCAGLVDAVRSGVGFAGWHGGVLGTFVTSRDYLRMVGGQFLYHQPDFLDYEVNIRAEHPIVAGIDDFAVHTEQYWLISDAYNEVLATTVVHPEPGEEFAEDVVMPVVWTRQWGAGRVFVSAIGHRPLDLRQPEVHALTLRGLIWAARR
ncbi:MAG TPA: ThuA domain-containing protein [Pseudonocardiaceae bacterium]|nr:ThuA domain-containing protein [Pseudonocardiaceae bacterium]